MITIMVIAGVMVFADHLKAHTAAVAVTSQAAPAATSTPVTPNTAPPSTSTSQTSTATTPQSTPGSSCSFSASSSYFVPHGNESIQVSATVSNGVITGISIQNSENDPTSAQYQEDFAASYKSAVVGKKISGLQVGIIAGASDTTQGFNDALTQIASKAQS